MPLRKFRYLSHTADVEFVSYGKSLKEAIENAALALLNVALDLKKIKKSRAKEGSIQIKEKANKIEDLVFFVLQDILSKKESLTLSAFGFKIETFKEAEKGFSLKGRLLYKKPERNYPLLDVKAVTPHDLKITETKRGYSIYVVIDV